MIKNTVLIVDGRDLLLKGSSFGLVIKDKDIRGIFKKTSDNLCGLPTAIVNKAIPSVCLLRKFLLLDATSKLV